jgi:hypothetical protein
MSTLTQFQSNDKDFQLLQNSWATVLNPIVNNPSNQSILLKNIVLASGDNTINHLLGRALQGWIVIRKSAAADIFDKQSANQMPDKTLVLNSSAAVTVSLEVF